MTNDTLLIMLATGIPKCDLTGKDTEAGLLNENGTLSEKGKALARQVALDDPEVTEYFKERIRKGLV